MATSTRAFLIELYEEYLEEASFLCAQRRALFSNSEVSWIRIGEFDQRLEAHVDGLVVGGSLALEICRRHAVEGDFGELYTAICVFCRQDQRELVLTILDQLDPSDVEKTSAAADALKYELPEKWFQDFITLLDAGDPRLAPILARVFGYRRVQCGPQLSSAMKRCAAGALPDVVWALGRVAYEPASGPLIDYLKSEDEPIRGATALALARMGEPRTMDYCLDHARSSAWAVLPLGLAGGRRTLALLTDLAEKDSGGDCLIALGLLGDPASVPLLISRMEQPNFGPSAATALQCITGAGLCETVFIPDEVDEEELFDSEREQLKQGKPLDRGDGRPFGSTVTRLSQNPEDWNRWWQANGARFTPGIAYRNGGPLSPARLIDMLAAENTPHKLRWCCAEELVTRYGKDFGMETDMPVARQIPVLSQAVAWSQSIGGRFHEGVWYFSGSRIE